MDDLGGNSRDLRALGLPNPVERDIPWQEREDAVQRRGARQTIAGIITLVATYLLYMGGAVATNNETADSETAGLLLVLCFTTTQMVGAILLAFGMLERHNRPYRVHLRRMVESAEEAAAGMQTMAALAGPLNDRIGNLERNVEGQIADISRAIGLIAQHMPENQKLHNWRGANDALRHMFAAQQNGTEGNSQSRTRLSAVRDPETPEGGPPTPGR